MRHARVGLALLALFLLAGCGDNSTGPGAVPPRIVRLTPGSGDELRFDWSPDGSRIVYESRAAGTSSLWTVPSRGGEAVRITADSLDAADPHWSPDGARIAFLRWNETDEEWEGIWTVPAGGGEAALLTPRPRPLREIGWSPDGTEISAAGDDSIWIFPGVGGEALQAAALPCAGFGGHSWSRDGTRIAFDVECGSAETGLYILEVAGGSISRLLAAPALAPRWSPGDSLIAYGTRTNSGNWVVSVVTVDGGMPVQLTANVNHDRNPDWSPNGRWIAFEHGPPDGARDIWVMPAGGGTQTRMTINPSDDVGPRWSPDGQRIAFASNWSGSWDVWVMEVF